MDGADVFVGVSAGDRSRPRCCTAWRATRSSSRWRIPIPRSPARTRRPRARTRSWPRAAPTIPNQVNNVLGFPFIFRGALDVRASADQRGDESRRRAGARPAGARGRARAGAEAYASRPAAFRPRVHLPKPFDPRVLLWVAPAVAKAAMASGVARKPIADLEAYRESLERIMGRRERSCTW